jgi:hypothetical protein
MLLSRSFIYHVDLGSKIKYRTSVTQYLLPSKTFLLCICSMSSMQVKQLSEHCRAECYLIGDYLLCRPVA